MSRTLVAMLGASLLSGCTLYDVEPSAAAMTVPRVSAAEAAAVPEGARVEIEHHPGTAGWDMLTFGTVLKAGPEGLALANCTVPGTPTGVPIMNKVPYTGRLFKMTSTGPQTVPVLWVPLAEMSAVRIVEPPPADYVAPSIEISTAPPERIGVDFDWQADDAGTPVIVETE